MFKYAALFTVVNVVFSFALNTLLEMIGVSYGVSLAPSILAASFVAGYMFVRDHRRAPEPSESRRYALLSLTLVWLGSVLLTAVAFSVLTPPADWRGIFALLSQPTYLVFVIVLAAVFSLILYFGNRWAFNWFAQHRASVL